MMIWDWKTEEVRNDGLANASIKKIQEFEMLADGSEYAVRDATREY